MSDLFKGLKKFVPEVGAELKRLGSQGSMEAANALFNGHAFVPYGPGQNPKNFELEQSDQEPVAQEQEVQKENDGRDM